MRINRAAFVALCLGALTFAQGARAEAFIVKDGRAQAEIIVCDFPTRSSRLAAEELQAGVRKLSGAELAIRTETTPDVPVKIYVGKSPFTDRLKIATDGLKSGAFRMVSGPDWLALVGNDTDWPRKGPFHAGGQMSADSPALLEWDKLTGGQRWGFPTGMRSREYNAELKIWEQDERGSFNAVAEFERMQGMRWYMPGPFGEVAPRKTTIALPSIDRTVQPDFRLRYPYQYGHMFGHTTREEVLWQLRMGIYSGPDPELGGAHGMRNILGRAGMKAAHPDYYAMYDGKRATKGQHSCLSSEGLFQETVAYTRAMFDIYDARVVSVMPEDGYVNLCQCDLCKGKDAPQRGWTGQISDYVWDFVNRVAKEVEKTHPDRKVTCAAYGAYLLPPERIDKLNPNVVVAICQWRGDFHDRVVREQFVKLREGWLKKLPPGSQLSIADYYLHPRPKGPWDGIPVFYPRLIAEDLRALKGISQGDFIETYRDFGEDLHCLAANHLNIYVTSRLWWDANLDIDALLNEYYTLFYGPAAPEMKAFIEYSEANWPGMAKGAEKINRAFELLAAAQQKAPADSIFARRVTLIGEYMQPMKALREQLAKGRKDVPKARAYWRQTADVKIDGKLDEEFWQQMAVYPLSELQTGRECLYPGSFKLGWSGDSLYVGITCKDPDMKTLKIGTTRNEDSNMWNGDCVEILLETQTHAYYQIAVNPAGAVIDLDRKRGTDTLWASGARIAAFIGDGFWSVEARIPVLGDGQEAIDPNNGISGRQPTATYPWYFNICRQRMRDGGNEFSAFSPTSAPAFHVPMKFAEMYVR